MAIAMTAKAPSQQHRRRQEEGRLGEKARGRDVDRVQFLCQKLRQRVAPSGSRSIAAAMRVIPAKDAGHMVCDPSSKARVTGQLTTSGSARYVREQVRALRTSVDNTGAGQRTRDAIACCLTTGI